MTSIKSYEKSIIRNATLRSSVFGLFQYSIFNLIYSIDFPGPPSQEQEGGDVK